MTTKKRRNKNKEDLNTQIANEKIITLTKTKLYIIIYFVSCFICGFITYYNSLQIEYFNFTDLQSSLISIPSFIGGYLIMENTSKDRNFIMMVIGTIGYGILLNVSISLLVVPFFGYIFFPLLHNLFFIR